MAFAAELEGHAHGRFVQALQGLARPSLLGGMVHELPRLGIASCSLALYADPQAPHDMVMPLIGTIDSARAQQIMETALASLAAHDTQVVILNITGVSTIDTMVANPLIEAARAARLLGAQGMLTGIRPEVAQTLARLGVDLRGIRIHSTPDRGIAA